MPVVLHCRICLEGLRHQGGELPSYCPRCGATDSREGGLWITRDELPDPKVEFKLTPNDKRLLSSFRIGTDDSQ